MFSRTSHESPKTSIENNVIKTPSIEVLSSPDIVPPSPVMEKKKIIKAKRSLNNVLVNNVQKENPTISQTDGSSPSIKKTLDLTIQNQKNIKEDFNDIDSQSCTGTESMASTICDEIDFCSDLILDDWNDCYSLTTR